MQKIPLHREQYSYMILPYLVESINRCNTLTLVHLLNNQPMNLYHYFLKIKFMASSKRF